MTAFSLAWWLEMYMQADYMADANRQNCQTALRLKDKNAISLYMRYGKERGRYVRLQLWIRKRIINKYGES